MKNYRIQPHKISELVTTTVRAFEVIKNGKSGDPKDYAKYMHFMADLLKDLVDTAYPIKIEPAKQKSNKEPVEHKSKSRMKTLKIKGYEHYLSLMKLGELPEHLILTFEEWEKGVEIIEY